MHVNIFRMSPLGGKCHVPVKTSSTVMVLSSQNHEQRGRHCCQFRHAKYIVYDNLLLDIDVEGI